MTFRNHQKEAILAILNALKGIIHHPTGSGKTYIQIGTIIYNLEDAIKWAKSLRGGEEIPVFCILSPRILLSNQLLNEVRSILISLKIDIYYLLVHSGGYEDREQIKWADSLNELNDEDKGIPFRKVKSTTKKFEIKDEYRKAKEEGVPMLIAGCYHSAERINDSNIPLYLTNCDEAQNLVNNEFSWISRSSSSPNNSRYFKSYKKYFYTATLKLTDSEHGIGMNNPDLFGNMLSQKTPIQMIDAGEILRPKIHLISKKNPPKKATEIDEHVFAAIEGFKKHSSLLNKGIKGKLLIASKGSKELRQIEAHPEMQKFLKSRKNLKFLSISSAAGPRINGMPVDRVEFLRELRSLKDTDEAIIMHIDILTEGIDVPGITGFMPLKNSIGLSKFLQNLGRATRLHPVDRSQLYNGKILPNDLHNFKKPYAWIIIPTYGDNGLDMEERFTQIIRDLREYGFRAEEDVIISDDRGESKTEGIPAVNSPDRNSQKYRKMIIRIQHEIEDKSQSDNLKMYATLSEAKKILKKALEPFRGKNLRYEYEQLIREDRLPIGLHLEPYKYYLHWEGWEDYLGIMRMSEEKILDLIKEKNLADPISYYYFIESGDIPEGFPEDISPYIGVI